MAANKQDIDRLLNQARVQLVGASDAAIKATAFEVFFEFFDNSASWLEDVPFNVIAPSNPQQQPVLAYAVTASEGQIVRLAGVVDQNGLPQPAMMPTPGTIVLRNGANQQQGQLVFVATVVKNVVLPTQKDDFPLVPEFVLTQYPLPILNGVLGRMMLQPNKSYSNPEMAKLKLREFTQGWTMARTDTLRRNTFGTQTWRFPQGFRTSGQRGGISVSGDVGFR